MNKIIKKFLKREDGTRAAVWLNMDDETIEFAGNETRQYVANDRHDYRYTHGGRLYQQACDLYWELQG
jgi:hypothetical protein